MFIFEVVTLNIDTIITDSGRKARGFGAWWLGRVDYSLAWNLQAELTVLRQTDQVSDTLLLLEHPRTITLGRRSSDEHILESREGLRARGFRIHEVDRGGDVTYHGPGQLVGYPIVDLRNRGCDLHLYIRALESALIDVLAEHGIRGIRRQPHTGVWVGDCKIAAIGIKVSKWVTSHGFALNVNSDLADFRTIIPCGIRDVGVTSIENELGRSVEYGGVIMDTAASVQRALCSNSVISESRTDDWIGKLSAESQKILAQGIDALKSVVIDYRPLSGGIDFQAEAGAINKEDS